MTQPVAIFDMDFTMLNADSEATWSRFLHERGVVPESFVRRIDEFYVDYDNGVLDFTAYIEFLLHPLSEHPLETLQELRADYLHHMEQFIRPQMVARVQKHTADGYRCLLISAANSFLAEPLAEKLGFRDLVCTRAEFVNGAYTGKITGIPAFRDGKVKNLQLWLAEHGLTLENSYGYGDSQNDLPILTQTTHPAAVTPDATLRKYALEHGWEIIDI